MPKLSDVKLTALIVGAVVDNLTTLFLMMLLATALASTGLSQDDVMNRMKSMSGQLLSLIIGLCCTGLGGYVAGRMAKKAEVLHGALVAVISVILALILGDRGGISWSDILGLVAMLPVGMAGGYFAQQRKTGAAPST